MLKSNAPKQYTVQPGDTLVSIADQYLQDPSQWPQLLQTNPHIRNPYKLYPGEILTLQQTSGRANLSIQSGGVIKLKPKVQSYPLDKAIPIIPLAMIDPFLNGALVISRDELNSAPYIVAHADKHITTGAGDRVYVMGLTHTKIGNEYAIFRKGSAYVDPETRAVLGYEAINIGQAQLEQAGNPSTLLITNTTREVLTGDRLQPSSRAQISADFYPSIPTRPIRGQIISVMNGVTQISQFQVIVIDRGRYSGVEVGNLLSIYQLGKTIKDPIGGEKVKLPNEYAGQLMVFRVFEYVSFGIVLAATSPIHLNDLIVSPQET
jgi:LysM repeat protein